MKSKRNPVTQNEQKHKKRGRYLTKKTAAHYE